MNADCEEPVANSTRPDKSARRPELDLLRVGAEFGVYRIRECVGFGGMGVVYRAEHTLIERTVALKVLTPNAGTDPQMVRRFFAEARAVNRASHPNIVQVTDLVYHDGRHGLVMEYLEGESLAAAIERHRRISVERLMRIALQVSRGLAAAHRAGVLHLDLTPSNVFLCNSSAGDLVKVLDFGLTNLGAPPSALRRYIFGTPHYMAPELASATRYDARADIYALGAVMFEALTGRVMFDGRTPREILVAHIADVPCFPPAAERAQEVPPRLEELVLRCLEKDPVDRPQSMDELADIIGAISRPARPVARVRRTRSDADRDADGRDADDLADASAPQVSRRRVRILRSAAICLGAAAAATLAYAAGPIMDTARGSEALPARPLAAVALTGQPDHVPTPGAVRVHIDSEPRGAQIWSNGEVVATTPATLEIPKAGHVARLQVRRRGFRSVHYEVVLEGDAMLHFVLEPVRASRATGPPHDRSRPARSYGQSAIAQRRTD